MTDPWPEMGPDRTRNEVLSATFLDADILVTDLDSAANYVEINGSQEAKRFAAHHHPGAPQAASAFTLL